MKRLGVFRKETFFESLVINFIEYGFQSIKTFLEDLVPVFFCEMNNDRYKKREDDLPVGFENSKEVVVFKETHGSICDLKMRT